MKIKSLKLRRFILKISVPIRKVYSPVVFWILWVFYIRWKFKRAEILKAEKDTAELFSKEHNEFVEEIRKYGWIGEPGGGLLDFTYEKSWLFFQPRINEKLGRDCDDFAAVWYKYVHDKGYDECAMVLCMDKEIKTSHLWVVARRDVGDRVFFVFDNNQSYVRTGTDDYKTVISEYLTWRNKKLGRENETAWVVYKRYVNNKLIK